MGKKSKHRKLGILIDDRTVRVVEMEVVGSIARICAAASAYAKTADDAGLAAALTEALQASGTQLKTAYLAIADRSMVSELVPLPQLKAADKAKVLERTVAKMLNLKEGASAAEFAVRPTREVVKPEGKLDEHIFVALPKTAIERHLRVCDSAGLEILSVVPLAEAVQAAFAPSVPKGTEMDLFVHFESAWTHLVLASETGWLYSRSLAKTVDSEHLIPEAELRCGAAPAAVDSETMIFVDPSADNPLASSSGGTAFQEKPSGAGSLIPPLLLGEIRRSVLFMERELGVKVRGIALGGPIRTRAGLTEELSAKLERPVRIAEEGAATFTLACEVRSGLISTYATAAGALLAGARKEALNLLPLALRPQTGISWTRTGSLIGAAACLLVCLAFAAVTELRIPDLQKQVEQFKNLAEKGPKNAPPKEDPALVATRAAVQAALSQLRQNRSPFAYSLEEVSRTIPTTLALSNIKMFRDESRWYFRFEGKVKEKGSLEEILAFTNFMKSLERSPLFENVEYTPFHKDRPDPRNPKPDDGFAQFVIVGTLKGVSG